MTKLKDTYRFECLLEPEIPYARFDKTFLQLNSDPDVDTFPSPVKKPEAPDISPNRVIPKLGPLFERIDPDFYRAHAPGTPLTVKNFDQSPNPDPDIRLRNNSDLLAQLIDPNFFTVNGCVRGAKEHLYKEVPELAWSGVLGTGYIQATKFARQRYGVFPQSKNRILFPKKVSPRERQMPYLPNVNFTFAAPEEVEVIKTVYEDTGLKHNYVPNSGQHWFSAHSEDQIYIVLFLDTKLSDTTEQQQQFLKKMFGDELSPEVEARIRENGGYPNVLSYLLLKVGLDAAYECLRDYNYEYGLGMKGERIVHFEEHNVNTSTVRHYLNLTGTSFYNFLCKPV